MNRVKVELYSKEIGQTSMFEKLIKSFNIAYGYAQNKRWPCLEGFNSIAEILEISVKDLLVDKD